MTRHFRCIWTLRVRHLLAPDFHPMPLNDSIRSPQSQIGLSAHLVLGSVKDRYFFFSTCQVRLRKRELYFSRRSFSPPGLRR